MVRLGTGLFGVLTDEVCVQLKEALSLETTISQVRVVPKGYTIGYDRIGVASHGIEVSCH